MTVYARKVLSAMSIAIVGAGVCMAQTNGPQTVTNWGESVKGVQMSISMTNNSAIEAGQTIALLAVIKNASTNNIRMEFTGLASDYGALLTSVTGKTYHLIASPLQLRSNTSIGLSPGEQDVRIIKGSGSMKVVSIRARFSPEPKKGTTMNYVGVDIHKRYSFVSA